MSCWAGEPIRFCLQLVRSYQCPSFRYSFCCSSAGKLYLNVRTMNSSQWCNTATVRSSCETPPARPQMSVNSRERRPCCHSAPCCLLYSTPSHSLFPCYDPTTSFIDFWWSEWLILPLLLIWFSLFVFLPACKQTNVCNELAPVCDDQLYKSNTLITLMFSYDLATWQKQLETKQTWTSEILFWHQYKWNFLHFLNDYFPTRPTCRWDPAPLFFLNINFICTETRRC